MGKHGRSAELLIIADNSDQFAKEIYKVAELHGKSARLLDVPRAARKYNLIMENGELTVEPDLPTIIRLPATPLIREDADKAFQNGEYISTIWAATALMRSPCINRPNFYGFMGYYSPSRVITENNAGITLPDIEMYTRNIQPFPDISYKKWGIKDTITYDSSLFPEIPAGFGPYYCRAIYPNFDYEIVVVVGERAWRSTLVPLDQFDLEEKSVCIMQNLGLTFGAIFWSISKEFDSASVAIIDPFPNMYSLHYTWDEVSEALMEALFE